MYGFVRKRGPAREGGPPRARPWGWVIELGKTSDGRRRRITKSGFATKRQAQAALKVELQKLEEGVDRTKETLTLKEYLEDYWLTGLTRVRPTTRRSYKGLLATHVIPAFGDTPLGELTTPKINALYAALSRSGRKGPGKKTKQGLSPASVRRVHAALHVALSDAVRWRMLRFNPATGAELPHQPRREPHAWTATEVHTFLAAIAADPLEPLYRLMLATGLRRGEACGLRWSDVDLENRVLVVRHQRTDNGYEVVIAEPKSRRGHRVIGLDAETVRRLARHRTAVEAARAASGLDELEGSREYVFTTAAGDPYHPDFVSKHFRVLVKHSGVRPIRLHDLRHTHATLGLAAGIPAKVMADRLGHSTTLLTLDTYSHVSPAMDHAAADTIAGLIEAASRSCHPYVTHEGDEGPETEGDEV